jgi:hypothetical protein
MVSPQTSLREKFFDVTIGERIPQIPTDSTKNDGWFEVSPFEWCRSWFAHWHQPTRPTCQICNTSHHRTRRSKTKNLRYQLLKAQRLAATKPNSLPSGKSRKMLTHQILAQSPLLVQLVDEVIMTNSGPIPD